MDKLEKEILELQINVLDSEIAKLFETVDASTDGEAQQEDAKTRIKTCLYNMAVTVEEKNHELILSSDMIDVLTDREKDGYMFTAGELVEVYAEELNPQQFDLWTDKVIENWRNLKTGAVVDCSDLLKLDKYLDRIKSTAFIIFYTDMLNELDDEYATIAESVEAAKEIVLKDTDNPEWDIRTVKADEIKELAKLINEIDETAFIMANCDEIDECDAEELESEYKIIFKTIGAAKGFIFKMFDKMKENIEDYEMN